MNLPHEKIYKQIAKIENSYIRELFTNYRIALDDITSVMSKLYEKHGDLTWAEMAKFNRFKKLEKQIAEILGPVYGKNKALVERLQTANYGQSFFMHSWAVDNAYRVSLGWGLLNRETIKAAVDNPLFYLAETRLKDDGFIRVKRAITQGLIRGDSYPAMVGQIRDAINGNRKDALRILRTEGQRAAVKGQQAQADETRRLGIEVLEIWDATLDSRTRPRHGALDGTAANEDGEWYIPGIGWISGPLQSGVAKFDINCRCAVREQLPDDPPLIRQIQETKGTEPYITFGDWVKREGLTENKYKQIYRS